MSIKRVIASIEDITTGGEAGTGGYVTCPKCGDRIQVAEYPWWDIKCSCGLSWEIDISAVGTKYDDDDDLGVV